MFKSFIASSISFCVLIPVERINGFDFLDEEITEVLSIEHSNGARHKISAHHIGDFNNDNAQDMILAYRVDDPRDNAEDLYLSLIHI